MKKVLSDFWQIYKKFLRTSLKAKNLRNRYTKKLQKAKFSAIRQKSGPDSRCPLTHQNRCFQQRILGTREISTTACDSWRLPPPPQIRGKPRQCALPRNATALVAGLGYRRLRDCAGSPQLVTHILSAIKPTAIAVGYRNIAPHGACRAKTNTVFGECFKYYLTADTQIS